MIHIRRFVIAIAAISVLGLGVFALARRNSEILVPQDGDPIIIKGGSLSIQCPSTDQQCLGFNASTKQYDHKNQANKIVRIVIKNSKGDTVFNLTSTDFGAKPEIDVFYK